MDTLDPKDEGGIPMGATIRPNTRNLFATIDAMDVATLGSLFARDGRVVYGNGQPMVGVDEIRTGTAAFFATIAGLHHTIMKEWTVGDDTIIDLKVTNAAGEIDEYRVYFDLAPVYA